MSVPKITTRLQVLPQGLVPVDTDQLSQMRHTGDDTLSRDFKITTRLQVLPQGSVPVDTDYLSPMRHTGDDTFESYQDHHPPTSTTARIGAGRYGPAVSNETQRR